MECCSVAHLNLLHNNRPSGAIAGGAKTLEMLRLDFHFKNINFLTLFEYLGLKKLLQQMLGYQLTCIQIFISILL